MFTKKEILEYLEKLARWNDDVKRYWKILDELSYEEGVDYFDEFYNYLLPKLEYAFWELEKKGVDTERLSIENWRRFFIDKLEDYIQSRDTDAIIIYGETMGFIKEKKGDDWKVFEGSDEPDELDIYLYRKLILGKEVKKVKLYSVQSIDFVESWEEEGIPPDVYFSSKKSVALHYWHPAKEDVLVEVELPFDSVIETAEDEYKTIRRVAPSEFKMRFV